MAFSVVAAYDDQSLMQQGLGVESVTSMRSGAFQKSLQSITDSLQQLPQQGKLRQMALDALLKDVAEEGRITPGSVTTLNEISALLTSILAELLAETAAQQGVLDSVTALVNACNDASVTTVAAQQTATDTAETAMNTCRAAEATQFAASATACFTLTSAMATQAAQALDCSPPVVSSDLDTMYNSLNTFSTFLSNGYSWGQGSTTSVITKIAPCKENTANLEQKIHDCDQAQAQFETAYCVHRAENNLMCTTRAACHAGETTRHNNHWATHNADATARAHEARVITYVQCVVDALAASDIDAADACAPGDIATYLNTYELINTAIPAEVTCTDVTVQPDDAAFGTTYYSGQAWHATAPSYAGSACP